MLGFVCRCILFVRMHWCPCMYRMVQCTCNCIQTLYGFANAYRQASRSRNVGKVEHIRLLWHTRLDLVSNHSL